jgi:hypothetical protein
MPGDNQRMERTRGARALRISATAAGLLMSVVVAAMWLRNFWWADVFWTPLPNAGQVAIASADGQVEFGISYPAMRGATRANQGAELWGWQTYTASRNRPLDIFVPWKQVIHYRFTRNGSIAVLPHWLLAIVPLLLAGVLWIRWSRRFTIRTLLVITTLVAMILALAVTAGE